MTQHELKRAQELQEQIQKMKAYVTYFSPKTNGRYPINSRTPFWQYTFHLNRKGKKKTECAMGIGDFGCDRWLDVDEGFIDHCRAYFENKLKEAELKFAEFTASKEQPEVNKYNYLIASAVVIHKYDCTNHGSADDEKKYFLMADHEVLAPSGEKTTIRFGYEIPLEEYEQLNIGDRIVVKSRVSGNITVWDYVRRENDNRQ